MRVVIADDHRLMLDGIRRALETDGGFEIVGEPFMTYDLRRLRLHGLIQRIPKTNRYQITAQGLKVAMFFSRTYTRLLRPGLAEITEPSHAPARRYAPRSIEFTAPSTSAAKTSNWRHET